MHLLKASLIAALALLSRAAVAQSPCDSLAAACDSLGRELVQQRDRIEELARRVRNGQSDLEKARSEALVLRDLMKGYVNQIDSLYQENTRLRKEGER